MTQQWSVVVEFAKEVGADIFAGNANEYVSKLAEFINDHAEDFFEALSDLSASVSGCPEKPEGVVRYGATISVEEATAADAGLRGATLVTAAARSAGLPPLPLVRLEVLDEAARLV